MEDFFDTIYFWLSSFYSQELDNYLYSIVPGYLHMGLIMTIITLIFCFIFYYVVKPVRNQLRSYYCTLSIAALIIFIVALWYTTTPLINNEIDPSQEWSYLDCVFFGLVNIFYSFVFYHVFSLIIKWNSPAKFVPFKKF